MEKVKWPTPATRDYKDTETVYTPIRKDGKNRMDTLGRVAANGGQLNPDWVEWLMGWPIGWSSLEPLTDLIWLSWEVDPADGEASRVINSTPNRRDWKGKRRNNLENISSKGIRYGTDVCQEVEKLGPGHGPIPRVATGVKDRVNRLQALGNGQVPACVAMAWQMLSE